MKRMLLAILPLCALLFAGCGNSESISGSAEARSEIPVAETTPTQGTASTAPSSAEKEEDSGPFFVPTEKIPVDVSVDFPVDI